MELGRASYICVYIQASLGTYNKYISRVYRLKLQVQSGHECFAAAW
jgi:hypothetical protein